MRCSERNPRLLHCHQRSLCGRRRGRYHLEGERGFQQIQEKIPFKFGQEIQKRSDFYLIDLHAPVYKEIPDVELQIVYRSLHNCHFQTAKFPLKVPGGEICLPYHKLVKLRHLVYILWLGSIDKQWREAGTSSERYIPHGSDTYLLWGESSTRRTCPYPATADRGWTTC